jgi:hypothetical protein
MGPSLLYMYSVGKLPASQRRLPVTAAGFE